MTDAEGTFLVVLILLIPVVPVAWSAAKAEERFYRLHARRHGEWPDTRWFMFLSINPQYQWSIWHALSRRDPDPDIEAARRRYLLRIFLTFVTFLVWACLSAVLFSNLPSG